MLIFLGFLSKAMQSVETHLNRLLWVLSHAIEKVSHLNASIRH